MVAGWLVELSRSRGSPRISNQLPATFFHRRPTCSNLCLNALCTKKGARLLLWTFFSEETPLTANTLFQWRSFPSVFSLVALPVCAPICPCAFACTCTFTCPPLMWCTFKVQRGNYSASILAATTLSESISADAVKSVQNTVKNNRKCQNHTNRFETFSDILSGLALAHFFVNIFQTPL